MLAIKIANKKVTVSLPASLARQLRAHLDKRFGENSRSQSMVVREALREYLHKRRNSP